MNRDDQKKRTHEAILHAAAKRLRSSGIAATSVADVMGDAGLTVGGFYAHFSSKQSLFEEALRRTAREMWEALVAGASGETAALRVRSIVRKYLSRSHRDDVEGGCPLPAAAAEVAREGDPLRAALVDELEAYVKALAPLLGEGGGVAKQRALALVALMYGGLSLARALKDTRLSDDVLVACRRFAVGAFEAFEPEPRGGRR